jgi:hypothetical protein
MPTRASQDVVEAERTRFRHAPRRQVFSTDSVLESSFSFQDHDPGTVFGHGLCEGCTADPTSSSNDVVDPPPTMSSPVLVLIRLLDGIEVQRIERGRAFRTS